MDLTEYTQLTPLQSFEAILDASVYQAVPDMWVVIVTDVADSTRAVSNGLYKEVNIAGAAAISAVSNLIGSLDFPFSFGGDGATILLPPALATHALPALGELRARVAAAFGLELRVGSISVGELRGYGADLGVARVALGNRVTQASFEGSGLAVAEQLLKTGRLEPLDVPPGSADISGFSCRWRDVPSAAGETLAIIIMPLGDAPAGRMGTLRKTWRLIESVAGANELHPVRNGTQRMIHRQREINREARLYAGRRRGMRVFLQRLSIRFQLFVVGIALGLHLPLQQHGKDLSRVTADNIIHADFRKYDGQLKLVVSCSTAQREQLLQQLGEMEDQGQLVYGHHISDRAVMTCLIHTRSEQEIHFIDGADGGYTQAAAEIKRKSGVQQPADI
ncbi:DUF3095 domain-containing protein [Spirochaeta africana]|nr:DUF3095 domain-containing protein [Spirochaeta africana]